MRRPALAAAILLWIAAPPSARADSIDGTWCNEAGTRQMQIEGTMIVTPPGSARRGAMRAIPSATSRRPATSSPGPR